MKFSPLLILSLTHRSLLTSDSSSFKKKKEVRSEKIGDLQE